MEIKVSGFITPLEKVRIIPRLDIKGPNLVKGIHLEGLRVLGKPWDFALKYYEEGADELLYMDVVASLYGRNNLLDIVSRTAKNIFIPLIVGGGIRTIEDIRYLLRAGADKVAINTAAIRNPPLIREAATVFGSQCVVVSIEAKKTSSGNYEALTDNGREKTGVDVFEWAKRAVALGAGEILITSVDQEGTGKGYDVELIKKITSLVSVPVIACGGAGRREHILEVARDCQVSGMAAASLFHYGALDERIDMEGYQKEGNIEFMKRAKEHPFMKERLEPTRLSDLKRFLRASRPKSFRSLE